MSVELEARRGLAALGLAASTQVRWNLGVPHLYEAAIANGEATFAAEGPLVARTGAHTGRAPNDKFIVDDASAHTHVDWGSVNCPLDEGKFDALYRDILVHLQGKTLFALDAYAGADGQYRMPIRVITELAWHTLFARNMFITEPDAAKLATHQPAFTVIDIPSFKADPARHGTRSDVFIVVNFARRVVLIGGTSYAGEIKKSIFTVLN